MATYYCTKVAQMFTNFWAIIKMSLLKRKTALATFGQLLGNIGPLSIPVSGHTDGRAKIWYSSLKYFFASCPLLKLFPFCHLPPKNHIFSFYCSNGPTSSQQASHCSLILFQEGRAGGDFTTSKLRRNNKNQNISPARTNVWTAERLLQSRVGLTLLLRNATDWSFKQLSRS